VREDIREAASPLCCQSPSDLQIISKRGLDSGGGKTPSFWASKAKKI